MIATLPDFKRAMIMRRYAIRHKPTGDYMPQLNNQKGYSSTGPMIAGGDLGPRLFISRRRAQMALNAWLRGEWIRVYTMHSDMMDYTSEDIDRMKIEPRPNRKKEDMEIVCFNLIEDPSDATR